jgi:periplasmic copper chaperone A
MTIPALPRWLFALLVLNLTLTIQLAVAASGLRVETPWARASLGGVKNAIVYGAMVNEGPDAVKIVGGTTPVASRVEFHIHAMDGSVMTMRQLDSIDLKAGETATLKPGGLHIMLIDLKRPLKEGESFPLTLTLDGGGSLALEVKVLGATAMGPPP